MIECNNCPNLGPFISGMCRKCYKSDYDRRNREHNKLYKRSYREEQMRWARQNFRLHHLSPNR